MRLWQRRTADNAGPFSSALKQRDRQAPLCWASPPPGASPWLWCSHRKVSCEASGFTICSHGHALGSYPRNEPLMADQIVITEKTSQAKDIRSAVGSRYGDILPAEGHLF